MAILMFTGYFTGKGVLFCTHVLVVSQLQGCCLCLFHPIYQSRLFPHLVRPRLSSFVSPHCILVDLQVYIKSQVLAYYLGLPLDQKMTKRSLFT